MSGVELFLLVAGIFVVTHGAWFWRHPGHYETLFSWTQLPFLREYDPYRPEQIHQGARRLAAAAECALGAFLIVLAGGGVLFGW